MLMTVMSLFPDMAGNIPFLTMGINAPHIGHLKQQKCICHTCGDKVQAPGVSRASFSPWLVGGHFTPVPSHGLCRTMLISSHKGSGLMGLEPTLLTSLDLIISVSKCNYILRPWRARTSPYELWGGETQ